MLTNPVIEAMVNRKSIRKYKNREPSDELVESIIRAGQQAPFAAQLYSLLLSRNKRNLPFGAPLLFTICVDLHKMEVIMAGRNWKMVTNDLSMLLFGIQDASLMAENMVIAGESFGLGSCFLGDAPYGAENIIKEYKLPKRVFPLVQLAMGYPAEDPPARPRYPMSFCLFEDEYPIFDEETVKAAIAEMDEGYLAQDYYLNLKAKIPMEGDRKETFTYDNYSWTEHISRKWGQWHKSSKGILERLAKCGLRLPSTDGTE